ncbi:MAG: DUF502 domain-containing protein [Phycisphaeraceae bacterium]|nr:DUF502 domain-containing protein [Phycisphaeraceae bacterium]
MSKVVAFLKATLLGGALVVLPAWLAALLLVKALIQLEVLVKPVSASLPEGIGHPLVIASLLIVLVCFAVGVALRTAIGHQARRAVESKVLERLPGYSTLRSIAEQIGQIENSRGFQPAFVEIEDALALCFVIEEHADGKRTVFVPSSPTPAAGTIYVIAGSRVHPIDVPVTAALTCITRWGAGSGELLSAMKPPSST